MTFPEDKARRVRQNRDWTELETEIQAQYFARIQRMFDVLGVPGYMVPDYVWGLLVNKDDPSLVVLLVEVVNADTESPITCVQLYNTHDEDGENVWRWVGVERDEDVAGENSPLTLWVEDPDPIRPPLFVEFRYQDAEVGLEVDGVDTAWDCVWPDVVDDMEDVSFQKLVLRVTDSYQFDNEGDDDLLTEVDS